MNTPFGVEWDGLEPEHLQRYFEANPEEPLLVEGKGAEIKAREITKQICAFANLDRVGYLVLGAAQIAGAWTIGGWTPPDEPNVWISNIVADTLDPRPGFDIRPYALRDGSRAAAIRVWPVGIPPCITNLGEIYERLPGRSVPVRESATLRSLIARGELARDRAFEQSRAGRSDLSLVFQPGDDRAKHLSVIVSASCPSFPADLGGAIHNKSVVNSIEKRLRSDEYKTFVGSPTMMLRLEVDQHALTVYSQDTHMGSGYVVRMRRLGSVAAGVVWDAHEDPRTAIELIPRLWETVVGLVAQITGRPEDPVHVALRVGLKPLIEIDRWTVVAPISSDMREDLGREIRWGMGEPAWVEPQGETS